MIDEKKVIFSICMCARNAEATIEKAIKSVMIQTCKDWELIIIDNGSTDKTWEIIKQKMQIDQRIKGIHLEKGVGWAKGTSICMKNAIGEYMTVLSADDFLLNNGSLSMVEECIKKEKPDIVWVGIAYVQLLNNGSYNIIGGDIPHYMQYEGKDKISATYDLMQNVYYNSLFHYSNIDFLKRNNIDFYEPFYGDCDGMTEAMCQADKMIMLDAPIYALTANTSQTQGSSSWKYNVVQWNSIHNAVLKFGMYNKEKLRYIAIRIMNNNIAMLENICKGGNIRDLEMNPIEKTSLERLVYVEKCLETEEFIEMFYYAGREYYLQKIFEAVKELLARCKKDGYTEDKIVSEAKWLPYLIEALCDWNGDQFIDKKEFDEKNFQKAHLAICNDENKGVWGYELTQRMWSFVSLESQQILAEMVKEYVNYNLCRIYELLYMAVQIKQRNGIQEVIKIVKECMEIFQENKEYLMDSEIKQVVDDIKMVANMEKFS